jgi:cell fate (sporulation/competence/biofilm development) regulator YmcA (YheA/YmcA/DUF963 family)
MNQFQMNEVSAVTAAAVSNIEILVFKTNLTNSKRISEVEPLLDVHPHIVQWNVDLNDCDNVLRIVSKNIAAAEVENMLLGAGYYCEELQ